MKYDGTRKSGVDPDVDIAVFSCGKEELRLLVDLTHEAWLSSPKTFETMQFRSRLRNLAGGFREGLKELGWTPENHQSPLRKKYRK